MIMNNGQIQLSVAEFACLHHFFIRGVAAYIERGDKTLKDDLIPFLVSRGIDANGDPFENLKSFVVNLQTIHDRSGVIDYLSSQLKEMKA